MARFYMNSNIAEMEIDGELWRSYNKSMGELYEVEELQGDQRYPRYSRGYRRDRRTACCAPSVTTPIDL